MTRYRKSQQLQIEARREKVANLYAKKLSQPKISELLGVSVGTINGDIAHLIGMYRKNMEECIVEVKSQEFLELVEMEREASRMYLSTQNRDWFEERLKVKDRIIKLLGLNAPTDIALIGKENGEPIKLQFDFSGLSPGVIRALAEEPDEGCEECLAGAGEGGAGPA